MNEVTIKLNWLKQTNGHKFTEAEFRVLIALFNHTNKYGCRSHPGMELLEAETGFKHAAISKALKSLCKRGWIHQTYRGNGKSGLASSYDLVPDAPNPDYRCGVCHKCSKTSTQVDVLDNPDEVKTSTSIPKTSISVLKTSTQVDTIKSYRSSPIEQVLNGKDSETLDESPTTKESSPTDKSVGDAATNVAAGDDPFDVPTETPLGVEGEGIHSLHQSAFVEQPSVSKEGHCSLTNGARLEAEQKLFAALPAWDYDTRAITGLDPATHEKFMKSLIAEGSIYHDKAASKVYKIEVN